MKLSSALFLVGLLIEIIAFSVNYAESIPKVQRVIAPAHFYANKGVETLSKKRLLERNNQGFAEIAQLFKERAQEENPPEVVESISVLRFLKKTPFSVMGMDGLKEFSPIEIKLSNGQSVHWELSEIKQMVDELKSSQLFYWALAIFMFGIIIHFVGFRLKNNRGHVN